VISRDQLALPTTRAAALGLELPALTGFPFFVGLGFLVWFGHRTSFHGLHGLSRGVSFEVSRAGNDGLKVPSFRSELTDLTALALAGAFFLELVAEICGGPIDTADDGRIGGAPGSDPGASEAGGSCLIVTNSVTNLIVLSSIRY